eukprot:m.136652 g.136652  ORF g.136652 m.136652 type:complete len:78 (-) comp11441_c1_seq2:185-418(-)
MTILSGAAPTLLQIVLMISHVIGNNAFWIVMSKIRFTFDLEIWPRLISWLLLKLKKTGCVPRNMMPVSYMGNVHVTQ